MQSHFSKKLQFSNDIVGIGFLLLACLLFFLPLFTPVLSLFTTPDFGQSDLWQLSYPLKYVLSESLRDNTIPLWNADIAMGFPQFAEGQTGTLNLSNLILYKMLPFPLAVNLGYIFIFLTTAIGTYVFARLQRVNPIISVFTALTFSFSGFFVTHMTHINLIQAASFLPWVFVFAKILMEHKRKSLWACMLAIILSQQLFSGFPQISFITLVSIGLYCLLGLRIVSPAMRNKNIRWGVIAIILFLLVSAIQIVPSYEFLKNSNRRGGFTVAQATFFSYPPKHLVTLIDPYALGDPRQGTYPPFWKSDGSIFWENTAFIGVLPLLAAVASLFFLRKSKELQTFWIILIISFALMTGRHSPLYFVYSVFPFSLFRVPSRFILPFVWSLSLIAGLLLQHLHNYMYKEKKKPYIRFGSILLIGILCVSILQLLRFGHAYNAVLPASVILAPPPMAEMVKDQEGRYYSLDNGAKWNDIFLSQGWSDPEKFLPFKNELRPNMNLLYSLPSYQVYPIMKSIRYDLSANIIQNDIGYSSTSARLGVTAQKMLSASNVDSLVSPVQIDGKESKKIVDTHDNPFYFVKNTDSSKRAYMVYDTKEVSTVEEAVDTILTADFSFGQTALVEQAVTIAKLNEKPLSHVRIKSVTSQKVAIEVQTDRTGILVLADSYYPGWSAQIGNKKTSIIPVNINQRGVIVPKGNHTVVFFYRPLSLYAGAAVSGLTLLFIVFLMMSPSRASFFRTGRPT